MDTNGDESPVASPRSSGRAPKREQRRADVQRRREVQARGRRLEFKEEKARRQAAAADDWRHSGFLGVSAPPHGTQQLLPLLALLYAPEHLSPQTYQQIVNVPAGSVIPRLAGYDGGAFHRAVLRGHATRALGTYGPAALLLISARRAPPFGTEAIPEVDFATAQAHCGLTPAEINAKAAQLVATGLASGVACTDLQHAWHEVVLDAYRTRVADCMENDLVAGLCDVARTAANCLLPEAYRDPTIPPTLAEIIPRDAAQIIAMLFETHGQRIGVVLPPVVYAAIENGLRNGPQVVAVPLLRGLVYGLRYSLTMRTAIRIDRLADIVTTGLRYAPWLDPPDPEYVAFVIEALAEYADAPDASPVVGSDVSRTASVVQGMAAARGASMAHPLVLTAFAHIARSLARLRAMAGGHAMAPVNASMEM